MNRDALLELARDARTLLHGGYPEGMTRSSGKGYAQMFRDLGYGRRSTLNWSKVAPAIQAAVADIQPALPSLAAFDDGPDGWFVTSMRSQQPGHADRIPRFWAALDQITGKPLLTLDAA
ncbi:hypothetical protein [uncultured Sphingomonas sp.]|uniref:hypothetical protein n=1 Tax=uncultured Sphingomonas sp. TaxID=158754 RepID=UPI0035CA1776